MEKKFISMLGHRCPIVVKGLRKKGKFIWEWIVLHIVFICLNTFPFMLTCVQIQPKGPSREIEQQLKQHKA